METLSALVEADVAAWIDTFVAAPNDFYHGRFAPCPYARAAWLANEVDILVWEAGDVRSFIRDMALDMVRTAIVRTRVLVFPPRVQRTLNLDDYIEALNIEVIASNIFLNPGVAKTTVSRHPGAQGQPYFIIVVNTLDAVLQAARSLSKSDFYVDWPPAHVRLVVERRAELARRYGVDGVQR